MDIKFLVFEICLRQSIKKSEEITTSVIGTKQPIPRHVPPHMRHYPQHSQDKMLLEGPTHQPTLPHPISSGNLISKSVVLPANSDAGYGFTLRQVSIGELYIGHWDIPWINFCEPQLFEPSSVCFTNSQSYTAVLYRYTHRGCGLVIFCFASHWREGDKVKKRN